MVERPGANASAMRLPALRRGDALLARRPAVGLPDALFGRLSEISAPGAAACLTAAMNLVREVQRRGEPAVWITQKNEVFFPPDARDRGVDLATLAVVRVPPLALLRAVDKTARSGGFGLIVADLSGLRAAHLPRPADAALSRLLGLARKHDVAVVFLTRKDAGLHLGSLVSLRIEAARTRTEAHLHEVTLCTIKDKQRPPGRRLTELCHGPAGMP